MDETIAALNDPKVQAAMGPLGSRWQEFVAGKIGSSDPTLRGLDADTISKLNRLRAFMSLEQTGTARAHAGARGSQGLQDKFENLVNSTRMDARTAIDSLTAARDFLSGYEKQVYGDKDKGKTSERRFGDK